MHHISVQIIDDTDSDESFDDFDSLYDDSFGDKDVFRQNWSHKDLFSPTNPTESPALDEAVSAYEEVRAAIADLGALRSILQNNPQKKTFSTVKIPGNKQNSESPDFVTFKRISTKKKQLEESSDILRNSAEELRSQIMSTRGYFREVEELSHRFPLHLEHSNEGKTEIAISTAISTKNYMIIDSHKGEEDEYPIEWKLSTPTHFSFNKKSFDMDLGSNYIQNFFQLMCHHLFHRIKNDHIKSSIHYSAEKGCHSVYFDVGAKEPWIFDLGEENEKGLIPIWFPRLIKYIINQKSQPATFMKQLLYFRTTYKTIRNALLGRFMACDYCSLLVRAHSCLCAYQISSKYLELPYIAFIDKWRVSLTETPNEMRCIPYSTDGRGLTPALDKWCDISFSTLFLSMAEKVVRSFGFVFKNKNQYGTATVDGKKIKFKPLQKSSNVEISITSHATKVYQWNEIPGSNYLERMCVILFSDI